jgi:osmotically-inducible protein OsmY
MQSGESTMIDTEVQENVRKALEFEPSIDAANVGVAVERGVVTLGGEVRSYAEKAAAERVATAVYGARAVANELTVRLPSAPEHTDTEIAQAALSALQWNAMVPHDRITVGVTNGWVTLRGGVDWEYQRSAAANAVRDLVGVRGLSNAIMVQPRANVSDVKAKIEAALKRSAEVDARRITVAVSDGKVVLTGNVHSGFEREQARHAAWSAPGVREVEDKMAVVP